MSIPNFEFAQFVVPTANQGGNGGNGGSSAAQSNPIIAAQGDGGVGGAATNTSTGAAGSGTSGAATATGGAGTSTTGDVTGTAGDADGGTATGGDARSFDLFDLGSITQGGPADAAGGGSLVDPFSGDAGASGGAAGASTGAGTGVGGSGLGQAVGGSGGNGPTVGDVSSGATSGAGGAGGAGGTNTATQNTNLTNQFSFSDSFKTEDNDGLDFKGAHVDDSFNQDNDFIDAKDADIEDSVLAGRDANGSGNDLKVKLNLNSFNEDHSTSLENVDNDTYTETNEDVGNDYSSSSDSHDTYKAVDSFNVDSFDHFEIDVPGQFGGDH